MRSIGGLKMLLKYGSEKNPPLLFIHGFLGCAEDFCPIIRHLKGDYHCLSIDLPKDCPTCSNLFPYMCSQIIPIFQKYSPVCAIGYSLGGRILFELAKKKKIDIPLIILSSHLGLKSEKEKKERYQKDFEWADSLKKMPFEKFLNKWYGQPLFERLRLQKSVFQAMLERRKKYSVSPFLPISLSIANQTCFDPISYLKPILFLYGEKDIKYRDLYSSLPLAEEIPGASHCLHLEKPIYISKIIQTFLRIHELARNDQISRH